MPVASGPGPALQLDDYEVPFRGIVEQSIAGIYILQDGRFQYVNETFARMCGLRREQLVGAELRQVANPLQAGALLSQYERRIRGDSQDERFVIRRTSARRPGSFEIHGTRVVFRGRPAIVGVGIDITEQEQQRAELLTARSRLQELIANANDVRERERNRVAQELHDVVGGNLTAAKFDVTRLLAGLQRLAPDGPAGAESSALAHLQATAQQALQVLQETIAAVRAISEGLRPGTLDHLNLRDTLAHELDRFEQRYGIRCQLRTEGACRPLDADRTVSVFRVFQQALTNVARHARATSIEVGLAWGDTSLTLTVCDNGLGFSTDHHSPCSSLGLLGMQERARELGGSLRLGAGPHSGALVQLEVPLADAPAAGGPS